MAGSWLHRLTHGSTGSIRLICFPPAGGSAAAFREWPKGLPSQIEVLAIQYPGRGSRIAEAPVDRIPVMAQFIVEALLFRSTVPTVFFGHSMGGLVAFEVARQLAASAQPLPHHVVVSAHAPPNLPTTHPPISHLPDAAFLSELDRRFAAVPAELMNYPDVLELLLPALRADIAAVEDSRHSPLTVLTCPITAFGGSDDAMATQKHLEAWRELTSGPFDQRSFPGGHFYINTQREAVLAEIRVILDAIAPDAALLEPAASAATERCA